MRRDTRAMTSSMAAGDTTTRSAAARASYSSGQDCMDTGYVQLLDPETRARVLDVAAAHADDHGFVAGAFVADSPGAPFDLDAYVAAMQQITGHGGTPVVFPSHGLNALDDAEWVAAHEQLGARFDRFIGFELGAMFVPYGRIYSLDAYEGLLGIDACMPTRLSSGSRTARLRPFGRANATAAGNAVRRRRGGARHRPHRRVDDLLLDVGASP